MSQAQPHILIIELGSQVTSLIARVARDLGYRSAILDPKKARLWLLQNKPKAIILSGGKHSVYEKDAPRPPEEVLTAKTPEGKLTPILGICYGHQWIAHRLGGKVKEHTPEYARTTIEVCGMTPLFFSGTPPEQDVWMSHGDAVVELPPGFEVLARSRDGGTIAAMASDRCIGVQFHPEVSHTQYGKPLIENFIRRICECEPDWEETSVVTSIREYVLEQMRPEDIAIGLFSGGVDSTTLATALVPVLGKRLVGVVIDGGNLRENELDEIKRHAEFAGLQVRIIDVRTKLFEALKGITDGKEKRIRFQKVYVEAALSVAREVGATVIIQGTLAPDLIESGATGGDEIKRHHNVGADWGNLKQLHPLGELFKYEVRAIAAGLGLPESVSKRKPFPGPGDVIRVIGEWNPENAAVVVWAEARVDEILRKMLSPKEYEEISSQNVVAYFPTKTTGVKGDANVQTGFVAVRGVKTIDFMTAEGVEFPPEIRREIKRVLTKHPKIVRVFFDETDKPPATTEFE